jgi:hypothetical protein
VIAQSLLKNLKINNNINFHQNQKKIITLTSYNNLTLSNKINFPKIFISKIITLSKILFLINLTLFHSLKIIPKKTKIIHPIDLNLLKIIINPISMFLQKMIPPPLILNLSPILLSLKP